MSTEEIRCVPNHCLNRLCFFESLPNLYLCVLKSFKRDEDRWHQMEEKQQKEDEEWRKLREDGSKAKKNQSNVAYDIMTLQYSQDGDGQQQKYQDDMGKSIYVFGCMS